MVEVKHSCFFRIKIGFIIGLFFIFLFVLASVAKAEVLFEDNFNIVKDDVDRYGIDYWTSVEWTETYNPAFFGRTAIRNPKIPSGAMDPLWDFDDNKVKVGTSAFDDSIGVAKLRFDTYNPINGNDHTSFWGSEIDTGNGNNVNDFMTYSIQGRPVGEGISFEATGFGHLLIC